MVRGQRQPPTAPVSKGKKAVGKGTATSSGTPKACPSGKLQSVPNCTVCGIVVTPDIRALQCDGCGVNDAWKCVECLNLSNETYDQLLMCNELKWLCGKCENKLAVSTDDAAKPETQNSDKLDTLVLLMEKFMDKFGALDEKLSEKCDVSVMNQIDQRVRNLEERFRSLCDNIEMKMNSKCDLSDFARIEKRLQDVDVKLFEITKTSEMKRSDEGSVHMMHSCFDDKVDKLLSVLNLTHRGTSNATAVNNTTSEDQAEIDDINKRKTNVIVHGLSESTAETVEEKRSDDNVLVENLLHELHLDTASVSKAIRLGKRPDTADAKPRPIKLELASEKQKFEVLKQAKNILRNKEGAPFLHPDLTMKQRKKRKELVMELNQRTSNGEQNLMIYNWRIVQRRPTQTEEV